MSDFKFAVRVAQLNDAVEVDRLLRASYPELMAPSYDPAALEPALKLMTRSNHVLLKSGTFYVAESNDGTVVGCGGWTRERPGTTFIEPQLGHIRHFGTHARWTRRGIGREIYRICEAAASDAGIEVFEAYSSLNAESFYRALGFERLREIDIELQPQVVMRAVLMRRQI